MDNDGVMILVDFDEPGLREVSRVGDVADSAVDQSKQAIANGIEAISWVADKAQRVLDGMHQCPQKVELEFGIKVGSKAGVLISQAEADFHIKAKLVWKKEKKA